MKKVVVAGCLCLDITPEFHDSQEKRKTASEWFLPGKLLQVGEASIHTGGAVANTGLAFRHFGADVSLMGKVGNDAFGKLVLGEAAELRYRKSVRQLIPLFLRLPESTESFFTIRERMIPLD